MFHPRRSFVAAAILAMTCLPLLAADNAASQPASSQPSSRPSASQPAAPAATQASAITAVQARIAEAAKLLEAKDYAKLLQSFVPPKDLAEMMSPNKSLEALAKEWSNDPAQIKTLADVLHNASHATPTVNDAGDTVTFKGGDGVRPVIFSKIDGVWYINN